MNRLELPRKRAVTCAHSFQRIHLFTQAKQFDNLSTNDGIIYKAGTDQDPGSLEKANPIPNFPVVVKDSFLTNLRELISNMTIVY